MRNATLILLTSLLPFAPAFAGDKDDFRREADLLRTTMQAKAGPTDAEVGDAESFGKNVKWLGLLQSGAVSLQSDCTPVPGDPPPGPDDRCVTLNPAPAATTFDLPDIGRIKLPARASTTGCRRSRSTTCRTRRVCSSRMRCSGCSLTS